MTMTATNHDDQLGEIYPMMLNELNCTFGFSFSRFFIAAAIMVMVCGHFGIGPFLYFLDQELVPCFVVLVVVLHLLGTVLFKKT